MKELLPLPAGLRLRQYIVIRNTGIAREVTKSVPKNILHIFRWERTEANEDVNNKIITSRSVLTLNVTPNAVLDCPVAFFIPSLPRVLRVQSEGRGSLVDVC